MRPNMLVLFVVSSCCLLPACATEGGSPATQSSGALETDDQKILYVLGQMLGQNIGNADLTEDELGSVMLGLSDSALGWSDRHFLYQWE